MSEATTTRAPHYMDGSADWKPGKIIVKDGCEMEFLGFHPSDNRYRPPHNVYVFRVLCAREEDKDYKGEDDHWHEHRRNHHVRFFRTVEEQNAEYLVGDDGKFMTRW